MRQLISEMVFNMAHCEVSRIIITVIGYLINEITQQSRWFISMINQVVAYNYLFVSPICSH